MENIKDIVFSIETVVNKLSELTDVQFKLKNEQSPEYVALGQIKESDLIDMGFEFIGMSSYVKCPMYRYGKNIEALFNESILHIYDLNK